MRPRSWERWCTIISEPAKSNRPLGVAALWAKAWCEGGLNLSALTLPSLLALVPHATAPLAGFAGLCAAGLIAGSRPDDFAILRRPAGILGALVVWGGLSALWSIDPGRSLILDARLLGLFAAALALVAAAGQIASPRRLTVFIFAGTAIGIVLALYDLAGAGSLRHYVSVRPFEAARLNQIAVWLALLLLPASALALCRGRRLLALGAAAAMAITVYELDGMTAKIALGLSVPMAALVYFRRAAVCRIAAALAVVAIMTAPLILPRLAHLPVVFATIDGFKLSAGHRLLIWSFTGTRIAERPLSGWGLDSARAIPGGKVELRPGQPALPLHPHDAALQVWLELGAPGATLFACLAALLWLRLGEVPWPPLYTAAVSGSLLAAMAVAFSAWGVWQEWWLGTLGFALFVIIVMGREAGTTRPP